MSVRVAKSDWVKHESVWRNDALPSIERYGRLNAGRLNANQEFPFQLMPGSFVARRMTLMPFGPVAFSIFAGRN